MKRLFSFDSRDEAISALRKVKERKRQWEENVDKKLAALEQEMLASESETTNE